MFTVIAFGFITIIVCIYLATGIYLKTARHPESVSPETLPTVSVLIAMRNEEKNIGHCLSSLEKQSYPHSHFRVLILDDQSQDRSAQIAEEYTARNDHFSLMTITEEQHGLRGKMNALAQALSVCQSEIILITDADCIVPESWIQTYTAYFRKDTAMVAGFTLLYPPPGVAVPKTEFSLFEKIQAIDWTFLQLIAAYSCQKGRPVTVLGNNFGFRKAAYDEVGGYEKIGFSVTEDFALIRAIKKTGHWGIRYTVDTDNMIFSFPLSTFRQFFQQRKRWIAGGKQADVWSYFLFLQPIAIHLMLLAALFMPVFVAWKIVIWMCVLGLDYLILSRELKRFRLRSLRKYFVLFELFYFCYTLLFGALAGFPLGVNWKGRRYK